MILHYHATSPYSRKPLVAVLHRGDAVERRPVDVFTGALRTETFRALSPFGKIPVLETPEGPIIESTSIIEYLEERGPRVLLPPGSERIARHFDRLGDLYLLESQGTIWFQPRTEDAARAERETVPAAFGLFMRQLADGRPFVAGDTFTLGDLSGAIASDYLVRLGVAVPEPIRAWTDRCFALPAMKAALEEAQPGIAFLLARRAARVAAAGGGG